MNKLNAFVHSLEVDIVWLTETRVVGVRIEKEKVLIGLKAVQYTTLILGSNYDTRTKHPFSNNYVMFREQSFHVHLSSTCNLLAT